MRLAPFHGTPAQIVVLLRRLAKFLSLSFSSKFLLLRNEKSNSKGILSEQPKKPAKGHSLPSLTVLQALGGSSWPCWTGSMFSWGWPTAEHRQTASAFLFSFKAGDGTEAAETQSWFRTDWPWSLNAWSRYSSSPTPSQSFSVPAPKKVQKPNKYSVTEYVPTHSREPSGLATARETQQPTKMGRLRPWHTRLLSTDQELEHHIPAEHLERNYHRSQPAVSNASPEASSREVNTPSASPSTDHEPQTLDTIHQLLQNPALYQPLRTPRFPIVLCHGLYGFDVRGPSTFPRLRVHYWSNVLAILRKTIGADVIVTSVPGTGSIAVRASTLDTQLKEKARGRGINFFAHSMGGLDCRHLISHIRPSEYVPLSLTTIGTPHRGSPFMDWCAENIGIGKGKAKEDRLMRSREEDVEKVTPVPLALAPSSTPLSINTTPSQRSDATTPTPAPVSSNSFSLSLTSFPSSFTTLLLSLVDTPAYFNLTTSYLAKHFNPLTPDDPCVKYFSIAGRTQSVSIFHPFWLPKMVLDGIEEKERAKLRKEWEAVAGERSPSEEEKPLWTLEEEWGNDGLVPVRSAKWGNFLGIMEGCDHWEMRGARGIAGDLHVDLSLGDALGLRDWGNFVNGLKRDEKSGERGLGTTGSARRNNSKSEETKEKAGADADVRSSTDKLSAVFDWIVEQMPTSTKRQASSLSKEKVEERRRKTLKERERKHELALRADLERFYVALSRKLYDEGL